MKPHIHIAAALAVVALRTAGQTNFAEAHLRWFTVPAPHQVAMNGDGPMPEANARLDEIELRPPKIEATTASEEFQHTGLSATFDAQNDGQFRQFFRQHPDYGFIRTEREPQDPINRTFNAVFKPEPIHLGKHAVFSCTVWTAIKRKNPLCLLNPIVINASW